MASFVLQTYERTCIRRWLEAGHATCPKTQQNLHSTILTPNYALSSLITHWCESNGLNPPKRCANSCTKLSSSMGVEIGTLLSKLTSGNIEDQRAAAGYYYGKFLLAMNTARPQFHKTHVPVYLLNLIFHPLFSFCGVWFAKYISHIWQRSWRLLYRNFGFPSFWCLIGTKRWKLRCFPDQSIQTPSKCHFPWKPIASNLIA